MRLGRLRVRYRIQPDISFPKEFHQVKLLGIQVFTSQPKSWPKAGKCVSLETIAG